MSEGARPLSVDDLIADGPASTREQSAALFHELCGNRSSQRRRSECREQLVHLHLPLVEHCAGRFRNRGEPHDDLVQVATIGLIKSIDRFDPERGVEFSSYATPTIIGEIKRHFRDKGWAIRVPRRLQELRMQIGKAGAALAQSLGRSATPREIAERLGITVEEVLEGLESANAYSALSLDAGERETEGDTFSLIETLGEEDAALEHVVIRETIQPVVDQLPARERQILLLRFFRGMTQSQIAAEVGISQMHVSRLLTRTLEDLRLTLDAQDTPGP